MVQLAEQDLKGMTPEEIDAARQAGRCDALLGRPAAPAADEGPVTAEQLRGMSPEQIAAAHDAGRLDGLLGSAT